MRAIAVRSWLAVFGLLALGCAPKTFTVKTLPSAVAAHREEALDPALFAKVAGQQEGDAYRIGPGDTLIVAVYGHPELAFSQYSGVQVAMQNGRAPGLVIDNDGTIQLPLIGSVHVAGKTSEQLRSFLEQELARYLKEPHVTVQIVFNGSIRYYLLGQFTDPGLKFSDRPLRLFEALSLGGSVMLDKASLRGAYVARGNKRIPVNFRRLLRSGDLTQNIPLRTGDIVFVPDNLTDQAFVFGGSAGGNANGGPVPFVDGRLDIVQALAHSGFGFRDLAQARLAKVRVLRSEGDRGEYFVVNVTKIMKGEAANFPLAPGDIVYVPANAMTNWNQAMEQLLPTLSTVANLLTPFVQLKYLQE